MNDQIYITHNTSNPSKMIDFCFLRVRERNSPSCILSRIFLKYLLSSNLVPEVPIAFHVKFNLAPLLRTASTLLRFQNILQLISVLLLLLVLWVEEQIVVIALLTLNKGCSFCYVEVEYEVTDTSLKILCWVLKLVIEPPAGYCYLF